MTAHQEKEERRRGIQDQEEKDEGRARRRM
jgi:hypothetical protein